MSKEVVTQETADKFKEVDALFLELREKIKTIKNPVAKKLFQAAMVPLAVLIDYSKIEFKYLSK